MCVVAAFYCEKVKSFVIAKNRDRNYRPVIRMRKSFREDIERLYIWDEKTKYTEGVNEFGVGILSAAVQVKEDEAEGRAQVGDRSRKGRTFYSPDGLRIRKALFEKTAEEALSKLIELEIPGNTIIASADKCFLLEGSFIESPDDSEKEEYSYQYIEVHKHEMCVRTNHGILLPWTGYSAQIPEQAEKRKSSDIRYEIVKNAMYGVKTPEDLLDALSISDVNEDPQMNPLRNDESEEAMRTTGQILLIPGQRTLCYRPVHCKTKFNFDALNHRDEKCFFEIISHRKLLSFKDCENINS